jgi:hypothetical protein
MPSPAVDQPALSHSSLVLSLAAAPDRCAAALAALQGRPDLELGTPSGRWVPAVLSSPDPLGACREIEALPGVEYLEVVFVSLAEARPAHPSGASGPTPESCH